MRSARKSRAKPAETIEIILEVTEKLLIEEGYASVSTRRVAKEAGLNAPLVHYYFATTDDLLVAMYHQAAQNTLNKYVTALASKRPLHALWVLAVDPAHTALAMEFMALANHRKGIRAEISRYGEQLRSVQIEALKHFLARIAIKTGPCGPAGLSVIFTAIARTLVMEKSLGIHSGHDEARAYVEWLIARVEK